MSYSSNLKTVLCKYSEKSGRHMRAECYGLLLTGRDFSDSKIRITTESQDVAEHCQTALQLALAIEADIIQPGSGHVFHVTVPEKTDIRRILEAYDQTELFITHANFEKEGELGAFLRGAFLTSGSMDNPDKRYHLEFTLHSEALADDLFEILTGCGMKPLKSQKGLLFMVYFRESESIEDLLTLMGAADFAMALMNLKIYKDFRNIANRRTNCETANISRTINAAIQQTAAIHELKESGGFYLLTDELQEVALLRLMNPEMSISEMALACGISRSGVSHRLRKILKIAEAYKNTQT